AIMAGVFNDWNVYHQPAGIDLSSFGAQLAVSPVDGLDMYFNFVTGDNDGSELDLTAGYQISDQFYIGLNAASWKVDIPAINDEASFKGAALYAQYGVSDVVALGLRGEMFSTKNSGYIGYDLTSGAEAEGVTAITLSANIGSGALKLIPEFRFDSASEAVFTDANSNPTNLAVQGLVAAVFAF
ncbi:MAG: porin, partial [Cyclobacteriaceae bacterium]|nr:porin [Cyclobacteriaceae bacterium]